MSKQEKYLKISEEILQNVGGKENIQGVAHCATRLRLVLDDNSKANMDNLDNIELVKGVFIVGDQLQIIFGAGLVNEIYDVFSKLIGMENMSLSDVKSKSAQKQNPLQRGIKSLSDVFIDIMPGILAAALLMGLSGLLGQTGLFGEKSIVQMYTALAGVNRFVGIVSSSVFSILPLIVVYSATRRYGGKPVLGLVIGAVMLNSNLANAYDAAKGTATPEIINVLGLNIKLVGFQGGIIIALMMGFVVAKLDNFFDKKVHNSVKLLVSPMLTVFVASFLLFTIIGPVGRGLASGVTTGLLWITQNLGIFGYMLFAGVQQIIVITGIHHIMGAIEGQLLADTGTNFLNPLMSVAVAAQGGAVLGYLALHWKDVKTRELAIPAFTSTLFGISEPAIFGVNLRNKFPLVAGCFGSAIA
ncbi:PTS transporter subunit EIIC [Clostridium saccharobutylicum]|uniref:Negative regulator of SacY activity n=1 Tax=Clostridium saccharobutylicum TaxID=169679 RepID=A0A1S8NBU8_CLOSA|nr:PTS transporter subunit EIIC [Clostridium saccharobutylicum]OOM13947.1 negative regulator of SacY activity [Clostridium saccharobutylicum]